MFLESRANSIPRPYQFPATGKFEGNDGQWSTFRINVGDNGTGQGQDFRVLISTSSFATILPQQASWCSTSECASARGIEVFQSYQPLGFESEKVENWKEVGQFNIPSALDIPRWPDDNPNGTYGQASVGLGITSSNSDVLDKQIVIETRSQNYFMGSFGLASLPARIGEGLESPFLVNYENTSIIPSVSYGYTAGAYYRE